MENYQPNSHRSREARKEESVEKKKVQKVISGNARVKKKSELRKFTDVFISEDAANVKDFILHDMLIPGLKRLTVGMIKGAAEMIFGETGDTRGRDRFSGSSSLPYVSYNKYSDRREENYRPRSESRGRTGFDYNDIVLDSKGEAEEVLDQMDAMIDTYGKASIGDLYDLVGIIDHNYMNNKYGWTKRNFHNAESLRQRDGSYVLKLPKALPLD